MLFSFKCDCRRTRNRSTKIAPWWCFVSKRAHHAGARMHALCACLREPHPESNESIESNESNQDLNLESVVQILVGLFVRRNMLTYYWHGLLVCLAFSQKITSQRGSHHRHHDVDCFCCESLVRVAPIWRCDCCIRCLTFCYIVFYHSL